MRDLIRIFMVGMSNHAGGVETYIKNLCSHLDGRYEIVYNSPDIQINGKHWNPPQNRHNIIAYFRFWNRFFRDNTFDVLYYNTCDIVSIDMLRLAKKYSIPVRIIHSHCANDNWKLNWWQKVEEHYSRIHLDQFATELLACSAEAGKWMFGSRNFKIIKNGVNLAQYHFSQQLRDNFRNREHLQDRIILGTVGRLESVKNINYAIDILGEICKIFPETVLLVIGDGSQKSFLERYAYEKQLQCNVRFLGIRYDVDKLLSAMDFLVMPSLFEGLPFILIEAQAAGIPCIVSSKVPKEADLTGLVQFVKLEDGPAKWAEKILECKGRERKDTTQMLIEKGYSIEATAKTVSEIIQNALD